jgi:hypothetical protein
MRFSHLFFAALLCSTFAACASSAAASGGGRAATAAQLVPEPTVVCELHGIHGGDPDRIANDAALTLASVRDTYPLLPPELRATIDQLTFVVEHDDTITVRGKTSQPTKMFMGWSAEDDKDYRYPDRAFAPKGTIKVNLTEVFVQLAAFCASGLLHDGAETTGCKESVRKVVAHEVLHAYQYHTDPVRDLASTPGACPDGQCDPGPIAETRRKIDYERAAWVFGKTFQTVGGMVAFSLGAHRVAREHSALFAEGGRYSLLGPMLVEEITPDIATEVLGAKDFTGGAKAFYEAQYRMPQLARDMHLLLTMIAIEEPERAVAEKRYAKLASAWYELVSDGAVTHDLLGMYPYLTAVAHRFEADSSEALRLIRHMPNGS